MDYTCSDTTELRKILETHESGDTVTIDGVRFRLVSGSIVKTASPIDLHNPAAPPKPKRGKA